MDTKFTALWEEFSTPLKKFIRKRITNEHDTDDILQEVFSKIFRNIDTLEDVNKIHSWVYQIAKNSIADFYRKKKSVDLTELPEDLVSEVDEDFSVNDEISDCLGAMINHLPDKYKEAIILTEYNNITQKQLSEQLGLSVSGAKSRVQRARGMLKDMILECCRIEYDIYGSVIDYECKTKECKPC